MFRIHTRAAVLLVALLLGSCAYFSKSHRDQRSYNSFVRESTVEQ